MINRDVQRLTAFFISDFYNILYLTGFKGLNPQEREAFVLQTAENTYLFTDARHDLKSVLLDKCEVRMLTPEKGIVWHLKNITEKEGIKKIGFESDNLTVFELQTLQAKLKGTLFIPTKDTILKLRKIKRPQEIAYIKQACQLTDECMEEIVRSIRVGQTEREIALKIEFWIKQKGLELAFDPIVAVEQNSAIAHYDTKLGHARLKRGGVILLDFGIRYKNYNSDITRMFFMGRPKSEVAKIYEALRVSQEQTIRDLHKFSMAKELDSYCRRLMKRKKLIDFPHSLGHGIGLAVHEAPRISKKSSDTIASGQVFTIEPGVYFKGRYGMRVEDTIAIDDSLQPTVLTKYPKSLRVL